VFCTTWMGKLGASVGAVIRGLHVRFLASCGPPLRAIPLRVAHSYAAPMELCLRAMTIAAGGVRQAQRGMRIGEERQGAGQQSGRQGKRSGERKARERDLSRAWHHEVIVEEVQEKTDRPESSIILLPGFWNSMGREDGLGRGRPNEFGCSSEMTLECGNGAGA